MADILLKQLRNFNIKKINVKFIPRHKNFFILKYKISKLFEENNIDIEDENLWNLFECALYCWNFCNDNDQLLFIINFWIYTILLDDVVYQNDEGNSDIE